RSRSSGSLRRENCRSGGRILKTSPASHPPRLLRRLGCEPPAHRPELGFSLPVGRKPPSRPPFDVRRAWVQKGTRAAARRAPDRHVDQTPASEVRSARTPLIWQPAMPLFLPACAPNLQWVFGQKFRASPRASFSFPTTPA